MALSFISYNVNGIRAALRKGFAEWVAANDFDIIGLQETKAHKEQVGMQDLEALGYKHYCYSAFTLLCLVCFDDLFLFTFYLFIILLFQH